MGSSPHFKPGIRVPQNPCHAYIPGCGEDSELGQERRWATGMAAGLAEDDPKLALTFPQHLALCCKLIC